MSREHRWGGMRDWKKAFSTCTCFGAIQELVEKQKSKADADGDDIDSWYKEKVKKVNQELKSTKTTIKSTKVTDACLCVRSLFNWGIAILFAMLGVCH